MAQPAGFAPVIGGWVFKKKGTGGWKRRWAIMYGTVLTWFEQPNTPESPQVEDGIFDVTGAKCLPVKSDKGKWKFSIEGDKKQLILYVEEEMARNQWINGIRSIVEGKFLKGQLMEKPALMTKDGTVLDDDEVKKLAKKGIFFFFLFHFFFVPFFCGSSFFFSFFGFSLFSRFFS